MSEEKDTAGSLFEDDAGPVRTPPEIKVSDDGQEAYIIIPPRPLAADIQQMLDDAGVGFNIDLELVAKINKSLYDGMKLESRYLLAKGKKPVKGQPGELILRTKKPEDIILSSEDLNKVDYRVYKRKMLALAEKEQPVAIIIAPTNGVEGMDVFGNVLACENGEEVSLNLGQNVYQQGRKLISKIDGLISYNKRNDGVIDFDVSEVYMVDGDVDYHTGNIDFPGSVIIKGTIKAGFEVVAKNEVVAETIRGKVITAGSVAAKQGIIGGVQRSEIRCAGSVYAKFMQFAEVVTGDGVFVSKSILSSVIYAQGEVKVDGAPGSIIGGNIYASKGVEAKVIGSESFVKTEIAVYGSAQDVMILRNVVERRFEITKNLTKIDSYLGTYRYDSEEDSEKRDYVAKLIREREELRKELLDINKELKSLQGDLKKPVDFTINVEKKIWPEVRVSVSGKFMHLKNEKDKCTFFYDKLNDIINFR